MSENEQRMQTLQQSLGALQERITSMGAMLADAGSV